MTSSPCSSMCFFGVLYSILRNFEFGGNLLWTVADKLFIESSKSMLIAFKNLADLSSRMSTTSFEQKAVV